MKLLEKQVKVIRCPKLLTNHLVMQTYRGSTGKDPYILKQCTIWRKVFPRNVMRYSTKMKVFQATLHSSESWTCKDGKINCR